MRYIRVQNKNEQPLRLAYVAVFPGCLCKLSEVGPSDDIIAEIGSTVSVTFQPVFEDSSAEDGCPLSTLPSVCYTDFTLAGDPLPAYVTWNSASRTLTASPPANTLEVTHSI